jgi:hypothetical protein
MHTTASSAQAPAACTTSWCGMRCGCGCSHCLCEREVALVGEGCVHQLGRIALVLPGVGEAPLRHAHRDLAILQPRAAGHQPMFSMQGGAAGGCRQACQTAGLHAHQHSCRDRGPVPGRRLSMGAWVTPGQHSSAAGGPSASRRWWRAGARTAPPPACTPATGPIRRPHTRLPAREELAPQHIAWHQRRDGVQPHVSGNSTFGGAGLCCRQPQADHEGGKAPWA